MEARFLILRLSANTLQTILNETLFTSALKARTVYVQASYYSAYTQIHINHVVQVACRLSVLFKDLFWKKKKSPQDDYQSLL